MTKTPQPWAGPKGHYHSLEGALGGAIRLSLTTCPPAPVGVLAADRGGYRLSQDGPALEDATARGCLVATVRAHGPAVTSRKAKSNSTPPPPQGGDVAGGVVR